MARNVRQQVVITPEQLEELERVCLERDFTGGPGKLEGEPNIAKAIRYLMGESNERIKATMPAETWARR